MDLRRERKRVRGRDFYLLIPFVAACFDATIHPLPRMRVIFCRCVLLVLLDFTSRLRPYMRKRFTSL
eukprot:COSAG05_NODE_56_length_23335_cov_15.221338_13_plen_67_part_00